MLTGNKIKELVKSGEIKISDYSETRVNPNSYNLTLSPELLVYKSDISDNKNIIDKFLSTVCKFLNISKKPDRVLLDMFKNNLVEKITIPRDGYILEPGILYLGSTNECTNSGNYISCIDGRSSVGRLGITTHVTAGFGDIGFEGKWTLEITVVHPVKIYPNVEICQIYFDTPDGDTDIKYDGKYQNSYAPSASKLYEESAIGQ